MFSASSSLVDIKKTDTGSIVTIKPDRSVFFKTMVFIFIFPLIAFPIGLTIALIRGERLFKTGLDILWLPLSIVALTAFWFKYLKSIFGSEKLTISKDKITYQNSFFGFGKYFEARHKDIKKFKHIGFDKQTKHPLEITGDALGFGTAQGEIDYLNQTGTLLLSTEYKVLKFGRDVDEEDYQRIRQLI